MRKIMRILVKVVEYTTNIGIECMHTRHIGIPFPGEPRPKKVKVSEKEAIITTVLAIAIVFLVNYFD